MITAMRLENFRLAHLPKTETSAASAVAVSARLAHASHFYLETCQRYIWLYRPSDTNVKLQVPDGEVLSGIPAYNYLLRIACGLESKIVAETDIFGQIKTALQQHCTHQIPLSPKLALYLTKIVEDAKRIRHEHLQGVASGSYGSIARALLKPTADDTVLILGAGSIARAIAPFFSQTNLKIWNRTASKAAELVADLHMSNPSVELAGDFAAIADIWAKARCILLCTPFDEQLHNHLLAVNERCADIASPKMILDVSCENAKTQWIHATYLTLADMFAEKNARAALQTTQVRNAAAACEEYAKLRSLALTQISAHCWEDLHLFVS